jgi:hypothetical protein
MGRQTCGSVDEKPSAQESVLTPGLKHVPSAMMSSSILQDGS